MSVWRWVLDAFRGLSEDTAVVKTTRTSRPMTAEEEAAFNRAFAKLDEAFAELRKIGPNP